MHREPRNLTNVAWIVRAWSIVTVQVNAVPEQPFARPPGEHGVGGRGHEQQELGAIGVVGLAIRRARVQVARQGVALTGPGARTGGNAELT